MGHREVRRVPLDFDWPLNKTWEGYLNPFRFPECPACRGHGLSPEAMAISDTFYPHQIGGPNAERLAWHDKIGQAEVDYLVAKGRLRMWNIDDRQWESVPRTAAEINAANRRPAMGSHDGINRSYLVEFRCKALGIEMTCPTCDGEGDIATEAQRAERDAWEPTQPPSGEGWQLWETTSEGSPQSPVFATPEELADWCGPNATLFASERMSSADWLELIRADKVEVGSLMIGTGSGYFGSAAKAPGGI
jgi:hypothetical protein